MQLGGKGLFLFFLASPSSGMEPVLHVLPVSSSVFQARPVHANVGMGLLEAFSFFARFHPVPRPHGSPTPQLAPNQLCRIPALSLSGRAPTGPASW